MLKMIPEIDSIFICTKGTVDAWGISSVGSSKTEIKCRIKESESSAPINTNGGKQVIPTFDISINGDVGISVGDAIEVNGTKMTILARTPKKDLSGKIIYIKYKV